MNIHLLISVFIRMNGLIDEKMGRAKFSMEHFFFFLHTKIISRQQRLQFGWKMILNFLGKAWAEQIKPYFSAFR